MESEMYRLMMFMNRTTENKEQAYAKNAKNAKQLGGTVYSVAYEIN
jgi:hypothetical protein